MELMGDGYLTLVRYPSNYSLMPKRGRRRFQCDAMTISKSGVAVE
jgi:hypothetical protein